MFVKGTKVSLVDIWSNDISQVSRGLMDYNFVAQKNNFIDNFIDYASVDDNMMREWVEVWFVRHLFFFFFALQMREVIDRLQPLVSLVKRGCDKIWIKRSTVYPHQVSTLPQVLIKFN